MDKCPCQQSRDLQAHGGCPNGQNDLQHDQMPVLIEIHARVPSLGLNLGNVVFTLNIPVLERILFLNCQGGGQRNGSVAASHINHEIATV